MGEIERIIECMNCGFLHVRKSEICDNCREHLYIQITLTEEEKEKSHYEICRDINDALFRFELFIYDRKSDYFSFDFIRNFYVLIYKTKQQENSNNTNYDLMISYYHYLTQMYWCLDKGYYDNENVYQNQDFIKDAEQLCKLSNMDHEFYQFYTDDIIDYSEYMKPRVKDIEENFFKNVNVVNKSDHYDSSSCVDYIKKIVQESDKSGWEKYFFEQNAYTVFLNIISIYLKEGLVTNLDEKIKIKKGSKSSLAKCFNTFYKRYGRCSNLKSDVDYFNVIRLIDDYKDYSNEKLYNLITK